MILSVEDLENLGACDEALEFADRVYEHKKVRITREVLTQLEVKKEWVVWLASRLSDEFRFWCAGVAFREAAKVNPSLVQYAMNVTEENGKMARSAAYAAYSAAYAAYSAADAADAAADAAYFAAEAAEAAYFAAEAAYFAADAAYFAADAAYFAAPYFAAKEVEKEIFEEAVRVLVEMPS